MECLVSAIITTYKRAPEFVVRAATSILRQTHKQIEIIVIDDSPDTYPLRTHVANALKELSSSIIYIQHKQNMGACAARNTGLKVATGEFVAFLDDDDEWLPEKIEKQLEKFSRDAIALVYCGSYRVNEQTGFRNLEKTKFYSGQVYEKLIYENFIGSCSFPLIRKSCLLEIGGFDPLMQSAQDYDAWTRLSQKYEVDFVDEPLVNYYIHAGERITTLPTKRIQGQLRYIDKNKEYIAQNKVVRWRRYIGLTVEYAKNRQIGKSLVLWAKTAVIQPLKFKENMRYLMKSVLAYCKTIFK